MRVLIVEDDPTFLAFWTHIMRELNVSHYDVADNSKRAKEFMDTGKYDLLISDVVLSPVNGYDLAKHCRIRNPKIDVLLTTAYGTDLSRFDLAGLNFHLLHKPYYNICEVTKLVRHLLNGEDAFADATEDSFSENEDYPAVIEWKL